MDSRLSQVRKEVALLYEKRPYPPVGYLGGLFQRVRREERETLNYRAVYASSWGSTQGAAVRPRILVAGCGTFEPIVVALANPNAEILAVDLSAKSLARLQWYARLRGLGQRIFCFQGELENLPSSLGLFDYVIATGVIHHLPDPEAGVRALLSKTGRWGVFRFMVYSRWGRSLLYGAKKLAEELGVKKPRDFRNMIDSLPPDHPYKIYFHLYSDARSDTGLTDGFLHPCDHPFTALELGDLLSRCGLSASAFLHGPEGQPEAALSHTPFASPLDDWERLALLEIFGELQENFRFFARRAERIEMQATGGYEWNEALPSRGRLFSRIIGQEIDFDTTRSPAELPSEKRELLQKALFILPRGGS